MIEISKKVKSEIIKGLIKEKIFFIKDYYEKLLPFLDEIWDLRQLPSTDNRYTNAYDDIKQHMINNSDWTYEELFFDRLKILELNDTYNLFLESIVQPKHYKNEDEIMQIVLLINTYIEKEKIILVSSEYDEVFDLPIYKLEHKTSNIYDDIPRNSISFKVIRDCTGDISQFNLKESLRDYPSFILVFNNGWNDYSFYTEFALYYYSDFDKKQYIGNLKITDGISLKTNELLDDEFTLLDESFCSLGQSEEYYNSLKDIFGRKFESILFALRDTAFFSDIYEKFERTEGFKNSLIRYNSVEQLQREIKYKVYEFKLDNLYSFEYSFQPKYSSKEINISFDFSKKQLVTNRIYALIGKNGVGKTQLMTALPLDILQKNDKKFSPKSPLFSKVIAVSYSVFDNFEIPKRTRNINYTYCGLLNDDGTIKTKRQQLLRFHNSWPKIKENNRLKEWKNLLLSFINEDLINEFIIEQEPLGFDKYEVDRNSFNNIKDKLSSGQTILIYVLTEIIANIRRDSLILFDEPETHLHPNAIAMLINCIQYIVQKFNAYCIIGTHSPIIIQGLFSKNVFVIERHENIPSVRHIGKESFAENLTVLTEEIFGTRDIEKGYKQVLDKLLETATDYNSFIESLEKEDIDLGLNAKLYVKSRFS
jgi:predicted ATPase